MNESMSEVQAAEIGELTQFTASSPVAHLDSEEQSTTAAADDHRFALISVSQRSVRYRDSLAAPLDLSFAYRLMQVQRRYSKCQYLMACLSTLGGAYHLTNHPQQALPLATRQEWVGRQLGSTSIVVKSKAYQAINWGLIGDRKKSRKIFRCCKRYLKKHQMDELLHFVETSEAWLAREFTLVRDSNNSAHILNTTINDATNSLDSNHLTNEHSIENTSTNYPLLSDLVSNMSLD